jgi:hypothetical protein
MACSPGFSPASLATSVTSLFFWVKVAVPVTPLLLLVSKVSFSVLLVLLEELLHPNMISPKRTRAVIVLLMSTLI